MSQTLPNTDITLIAGQVKFGLPLDKQLILAQGTSAGSFTSGALITKIPTSNDELKALCGAGSLAYLAIKSFLEYNKESPLHAIIVSDNGSGVSSTGSIALTVSSPVAGKAIIKVGSGKRNHYELDVLTTSTATNLGDALVALITADENSPVTAVNSTGTITFTAKNKGTEGNQLTIAVESLPIGVTASITAFSGGATDPVLTGVLTKIKDAKYQIATQSCFLNDVKTHLETKFNTENEVFESYAVVTKVDSYANAQSALPSLASKVINQEFIKVANDTFQKGASIAELPIVLSARLLATDSLRLIEGASIARFTNTTPFTGGLRVTAVPLSNTILPDVDKIPQGLGWLNEEIKGIEDLGGSVLVMDEANINVVTRSRFMTAYKKTNLTNDGQTYRNLNKFLNASKVKEYLYRKWKTVYAKATLTKGSAPTGVSDIVYVNEKDAYTFILNTFIEMHQNYGLVQLDTSELLTELQKNIQVVIDTTTNTLSGSIAYRNMGQLENIKFNLTANS